MVDAERQARVLARDDGLGGAVVDRSGNGHTGTVNGGVDIDFPVTVQGKIGRRITTDLGRGGATIRLMTTNGGVDIRNR